jgi:hypothetical protein
MFFTPVTLKNMSYEALKKEYQSVQAKAMLVLGKAQYNDKYDDEYDDLIFYGTKVFVLMEKKRLEIENEKIPKSDHPRLK